jgi:cytochrome c oxidase accessory protein FixG
MGVSAGRKWVYAHSVNGRYQRIHRWSGRVLQAILFVVPWITVAGHPAIRIDIPGRRLYALGAVFTAQDTIYLVLMGLFAAFALFFFTSLFGRLWCGYVCPQTVFLEEWIRPIERFIEGERGVRMARDKGPWTWARTWRKVAKWKAFAAVSAVVALSFVSWFAGAREVWTGRADPAVYGVALVLGGLLFFDFAWFREQLCTYVCPYARFQGALADEESLVVSYDAGRGEPRKDAGGDCIDCKKCVAVCPQGIDIRDGYQLECITCGRCIDACAPVMGKLGKPNLVGYTSLRKARLVRPRTVAYGALLLAVAAAFVGLLAVRSEVQANLARAPGTLYVVDPDGWVRNTYLLRVTNTDDAPATYRVTVEGLPAVAEVTVPTLTIAPGAMSTVPLMMRLPPDAAAASRTFPITVTVIAGEDRASLGGTFKTPADG